MAPVRPHASPGRRVAFVAMVVSLLFAQGCRRHPVPPADPRLSTFLATSAELGAPVERHADTRLSIHTMSTHVRERIQRGHEPYEALFAVLFGSFHYERELRRDDPDLHSLVTVCKGRRGSAVGLGQVALAMAERLGLPLEGVAVPGHFYVRVPGQPARNFELLRRAAHFDDEWYRKTYGDFPRGSTMYGRTLSPTEISGLVWQSVGKHFLRTGDLANSHRAFVRAAELFPGLPRPGAPDADPAHD